MTSRAQQRLWGVVLLLVVLAVGVVLTLRALQENIIFFYQPAELVHMADKPSHVIRIGGLVETDSYRRHHKDETTLHEFTLGDGEAIIEVEYHGILPDLFREGQGIIALGRWSEGRGLFEAEEVLTKHDENYMPAELVDVVKESGRWQE